MTKKQIKTFDELYEAVKELYPNISEENLKWLLVNKDYQETYDIIKSIWETENDK